MTLYLGMALVLYFASKLFGSMSVGSKQRTLYLTLCWLLLTLVMGTRTQDVGTDSIQYASYFIWDRGSAFLSGIQSTRFEPLYYSFERAVGFFTDKYETLFLLESAVTVGLMARFIGKHSRDCALSIFLFQTAYFYCSCFNISRAFLGYAIALVGYDYAKGGKLLKSLAPVVVGSMFHTSAIVMSVCFLIVAKMRTITSRGVVIFLFGSILVSYLLGFLAPLLVSALFPRYDYYMTAYSDESSSLGLFPLFISALVIASCCVLDLSRKGGLSRFAAIQIESSDLREANLLLILVSFTVAFSMATGSLPLAGRAVQVFAIWIVLAVPLVASISKYGKYLSSFASAGMFVYYAYQLWINSGGVVPYESWLF